MALETFVRAQPVEAPPLPPGARSVDAALRIYATLVEWQRHSATVLGCPPPGVTVFLRGERGVDERAGRSGSAYKPARLNNAGVCLWCGEVECADPHCVRLWERSEWMVCPYCEGGQLETPLPCGCVGGVQEATRVDNPDGLHELARPGALW